jgi:hypothetical protein
MALIAKDPQVDIDNQPLRFGKYKGQTPNQIAEHDPGYITWLWDNLDDPPCTKSLALACEEADQNDGPDEYGAGLPDSWRDD